MKQDSHNDVLQTLVTDARWHNEPPQWSFDEGLSITTGERTDFWQATWYGFQRDGGHFLGKSVEGDFSAELSFSGEYQHLYDQAGLMLRIDATHWIKAGIEHSDGLTNFSVVVTRERSDWSVIPVPIISGRQIIRVTRIGSSVLVHFLSSDDHWQLMRVCNFPASPCINVGPMACSPERAGFQCKFHTLHINEPVDNPLHG